MLRKSLVSILLLTAYLGSCLLIYNTETNTKSIKTTNIENSTNTANYINNKNIQTDNEIIGTLTIEKLNLSKSIYNINSSHNNVEENVTILNDDINLIVLAAHSGPGYIAFFNDLDKLDMLAQALDYETKYADKNFEEFKLSAIKNIQTEIGKKLAQELLSKKNI